MPGVARHCAAGAACHLASMLCIWFFAACLCSESGSLGGRISDVTWYPEAEGRGQKHGELRFGGG